MALRPNFGGRPAEPVSDVQPRPIPMVASPTWE